MCSCVARFTWCFGSYIDMPLVPIGSEAALLTRLPIFDVCVFHVLFVRTRGQSYSKYQLSWWWWFSLLQYVDHCRHSFDCTNERQGLECVYDVSFQVYIGLFQGGFVG